MKNDKKNGKIKFIHIVVLTFVAYFIGTMLDSQIDMYESDIESKNKLVEYYDSQKSVINTDEYIEKVARDTLGYVKPYEKVFIDANK